VPYSQACQAALDPSVIRAVGVEQSMVRECLGDPKPSLSGHLEAQSVAHRSWATRLRLSALAPQFSQLDKRPSGGCPASVHGV
jgi:hypothetical protein